MAMGSSTEDCERAPRDPRRRRCFELEPECYWCGGCRELNARLEREEHDSARRCPVCALPVDQCGQSMTWVHEPEPTPEPEPDLRPLLERSLAMLRARLGLVLMALMLTACSPGPSCDRGGWVWQVPGPADQQMGVTSCEVERAASDVLDVLAWNCEGSEWVQLAWKPGFCPVRGQMRQLNSDNSITVHDFAVPKLATSGQMHRLEVEPRGRIIAIGLEAESVQD